jgi:tRNA (adenine37-N6)-methyltransferase
MSQLVLQQVGVVRSAYRTTADVPGGGAPADIAVEARFEQELLGIERSSHLIVVGYFHRPSADAAAHLKRHRGHAQPCGAFAARCPERPTPISVTVSRLVSRWGLILRVDRLDLVDGTPVLDLKPYVPGWDAVFSARRKRRVRQAEIGDAELHHFLSLDLENHLGDDAARPPAQVALAAVMVAVKRLGVEPRDPDLEVTVNRCDLAADALMGLLGATLGGGRLAIEPGGDQLTFCFRCRGGALELAQTPRTAPSVRAMPETVAPEFAERWLVPPTAQRRVSGG